MIKTITKEISNHPEWNETHFIKILKCNHITLQFYYHFLVSFAHFFLPPPDIARRDPIISPVSVSSSSDTLRSFVIVLQQWVFGRRLLILSYFCLVLFSDINP